MYKPFSKKSSFVIPFLARSLMIVSKFIKPLKIKYAMIIIRKKLNPITNPSLSSLNLKLLNENTSFKDIFLSKKVKGRKKNTNHLRGIIITYDKCNTCSIVNTIIMAIKLYK
jgi:hypothetical protein